MAAISEIIEDLESKIEKMFLKINDLENKNKNLDIEFQNLTLNLHKQHLETEDIKKKYNALKSASSFLGSEENKRETKLKINSLIREIDYCIVQLSE